MDNHRYLGTIGTIGTLVDKRFMDNFIFYFIIIISRVMSTITSKTYTFLDHNPPDPVKAYINDN